MSETPAKPQRTASSAVRVMIPILGSRILGLVRESVLNAIFGPANILDAYYVAFRFPNLLRDLFAEGALSTSFITTFSKKLASDGKEAAFKLAHIVFSTMAVLLLAIVVAGIIASPWIVNTFVPDFAKDHPEKIPLTIELTRIMFPCIFFVSLAAVVMGLLNCLGSFALPSLAPASFNAVSILSGLAIGYLYDPHFGTNSIYGFAIGAVLGTFVQLAIQIPHAWQLGYHPRWSWNLKDENLRNIFILMGPAALGGSAVQVNVLVNTYFASTLPDGSVTMLGNAFRLVLLPIGMFGVSIATVTLPAISRSAQKQDMGEFRDKIVEGLRLALFWTVPSSVGLAVLAHPIIGLIYEHGKFLPQHTDLNSLALQAYTVGLAGYACIKILSPAFYALDAPSIPLRVSLLNIGLNIVFNIIFIYYMKLGIIAPALATSVVSLFSVFQLLFALRGKLGGSLHGKSLLGFLLRLSFAVAVMGGILAYLNHLLEPRMSTFLGRLALISILVPLGAVIYAVMTYLLKLPEFHTFSGMIKRRLLK